MNTFVLKGHICHAPDPDTLQTVRDGYLVIEDGKVADVYATLPEQYKDMPVTDYEDKLIIPGMTDLHLHAPQFTYRGSGMDLELLDWLKKYTFPEEARYADLAYAEANYKKFAAELRRSSTTRACIFATIHPEATELLMELMDRSGIISYVGKVNMDRNSPENLCEENARASLDATEKWICETESRYKHTKPILTPRFVPSCTDELMEGLGRLAEKYHLPVQSHLSENQAEIEFVHELAPQAKFYGDAYDRFGLFGTNGPCVMAHCVHSTDEELALIKKNGVFIAHSPESNINLCSGVAPVSAYLKKGLRVGLATDVAGGTSTCMLRAVRFAIQASKLRYCLKDESVAPLTFAQAFYLATKGGGEFFGKVGAFLPGYAADVVVLDDAQFRHAADTPIETRLEQAIYLAGYRNLHAKYVEGKKLW